MPHSRFSAALGITGLLCGAAIALAKAPLPPPASAPKPGPKQYTIEQFMNTERLAGVSFSADEKRVLYSSNRSGIFNVYALPVSGGEPVQLTRSTKESTFAVSYFPHDDRFLYSYDRGGNENSHLFLLDKGQERDLTPGDKVKAMFLDWDDRGAGFYYSTNARDARYFDVFYMDAATLTPKLCFENTEGLVPEAISHDGKRLALIKTNTQVDSDVYLYDLQSKKLTHITPHKGEIRYEPEAFDPRGQALYLLSNADSEFKYVARYDLGSGKLAPVDKSPWDALYTSFSKHGKYRCVAWNEDAHTRIQIIETATGAEVKLPPLPPGDLTEVRFSESEQRVAFYLNGDRSPSNLFVYDLQSKKVQQLTHSLSPEINPEDLAASQIVRFKSFDGLPIPNVLYKPAAASASNKAPALVWVHGGPGGQTRVVYSALLQYLVNHGYVVLGINNRGSSGYGKTFFTADDGKHGREPLWDCVEAKAYLASLDYVDKDRIGIIGGSYGGYMVLAALAFKPEVFDVGVDLFGVSNWVRTLKAVPPYWESFRKGLYKELGDPHTQEPMLREISPLFHADKIKRPLMVLQGANDPRVIKAESDDIVAAARKSGVPVEYVVFDNEGHGFTKRENETKGTQGILVFLDKYLKNKPTAAAR